MTETMTSKQIARACAIKGDLTIEPGALTITNGEVYARFLLPIGGAGTWAINKRMFMRAAKAIPGPITVTAGAKVEITGPGGSATLSGVKADPVGAVYPSAPADVSPADVSAIRWVTLSMAGGNSRYWLNVVDVTAGTAAATDGNRLHAAPVALPDVQIPGAALLLALRLAGAGGFRMSHTATDDDKGRRFRIGALFSGDDWMVWSNVPSAEFPAWREVVPKSHDTEITFSAPELSAVLRSLMGVDHRNSVIYAPKGERCGLLVVGADVAVNREIACSAPEGAGRFGMSANFVCDAIKGVDGTVSIESTASMPLGVSVIRREGGRLAVIMPIRLD